MVRMEPKCVFATPPGFTCVITVNSVFVSSCVCVCVCVCACVCVRACVCLEAGMWVC